jgi:hypothetical protein
VFLVRLIELVAICTTYTNWKHPERIMYNTSKFFTYVIKTRPNLSTYSRKLGNYSGTIIFEIDIIKKSYPIFVKLDFFTNVLVIFGLFLFTLKVTESNN